jgi:hypothetical protein
VVRHGLWQCRGTEEALGVVRLLFSDTLRHCVSGCISLDRSPPGVTFWSLLGSEGGQLQGLMRGPRSPRAPRGRGKVLSSCVRPWT